MLAKAGGGLMQCLLNVAACDVGGSAMMSGPGLRPGHHDLAGRRRHVRRHHRRRTRSAGVRSVVVGTRLPGGIGMACYLAFSLGRHWGAAGLGPRSYQRRQSGANGRGRDTLEVESLPESRGR
jgi:hypothetical protein